MRRVRETIVAVEKQKVLHILCFVCMCVCVRARARVGERACACSRVPLLIQHAMRMRQIVFCLSGSTTFYIIS